MAVDTKGGAPINRSSIWTDERFRSILIQVVVLVLVIAGIAYITNNTIINLQKRGIASGFDFLKTTSGFDIVMSLIPYSATSTYGRAFWVGLLNTLLVSGLSIVLCTILGFIIGILRLSNNWLVARLAEAYVEIIRNIPLLLQILFWYFVILAWLPRVNKSWSIMDAVFVNNRGIYVPDPTVEPAFWFIPAAFVLGLALTIGIARWAKKRQERTGEQFPTLWVGLGLIIGLPALAILITGFPVEWDYPVRRGFNYRGGKVLIPEFTALLIALTVYHANYLAEIVRAGIQSVSKGQKEAAAALGLRPGQVMRLVVIPQAMRVIIPPQTSIYLNVVKNSSLAVAIGYPDLVAVFTGTTLNQTGQAVECIAITMLVYLTISLLISLFMNWYNKKTALVER